MTKNLGWIDIEATCLEERQGYILEIGFVVTDSSLNIVDEYQSLIDNNVTVDVLKSTANDYVLQMHQKNGLWDELFSDEFVKKPLHVVHEDILNKMRHYDIVGTPLCGSTISYDRKWLAHHVAELNELFYYRSIDVSGFLEYLKIFMDIDIEKIEPFNSKPHRALDDLRASVAKLRFMQIQTGLLREEASA